jgi:shikimate kinase
VAHPRAFVLSSPDRMTQMTAPPDQAEPPARRAPHTAASPRNASGRHPAYDRLRGRTIVLVGLMGAGKTTVGRGLAAALDLPFKDADAEIERAADRSVAEIFAEHGEAAFRDGERRVIARLLTQEPPHVLAAGGGAFMHPETRTLVRRVALGVWLKGDLEVLARRVARRNTRPLLHGKDPLQVLGDLAAQRYAHYAQAQVTVETGDAGAAESVAAVLDALAAHLDAAPSGEPS